MCRWYLLVTLLFFVVGAHGIKVLHLDKDTAKLSKCIFNDFKDEIYAIIHINSKDIAKVITDLTAEKFSGCTIPRRDVKIRLRLLVLAINDYLKNSWTRPLTMKKLHLLEKLLIKALVHCASDEETDSPSRELVDESNRADLEDDRSDSDDRLTRFIEYCLNLKAEGTSTTTTTSVSSTTTLRSTSTTSKYPQKTKKGSVYVNKNGKHFTKKLKTSHDSYCYSGDRRYSDVDMDRLMNLVCLNEQAFKSLAYEISHLCFKLREEDHIRAEDGFEILQNDNLNNFKEFLKGFSTQCCMHRALDERNLIKAKNDYGYIVSDDSINRLQPTAEESTLIMKELSNLLVSVYKA